MFRLFSRMIVILIALVGLGAPSLARSSNHDDLNAKDRDDRHGQWLLDPARHDEKADLSISFRRFDPEGWQDWGSQSISIADLDGLTDRDFTADPHDVTFRVHRDGGTFNCRGSIDGRRGAGTFELVLDPRFAAELRRRGVGSPTEAQQVRLVMANGGIALLDELHAQAYDTPNLDTFIQMANHGVSLDYVRSMGGLGYRLGSLEHLITARDHGVDPRYVRGLASAGYHDLPFEKLLTARDHGVDPTFIAEYVRLGYHDQSLDELISLRDHGVDGRFLEGMRGLGYGAASLDLMLSARDHGVDPHYVAGMAEVGFKGVALEDLIQARDHGVDPAFVRRVRSKRSGRIPLDEMIALRDRGF
jgi:hypothetical protein